MNRRSFFAFGCGAGLARRAHAFAKSEFWNDQAPAEWSESDIARLLRKSPWAKEVTASMSAGGAPGSRGAGGGAGMGRGRSGGGGGRGGGGVGGGGGRGGSAMGGPGGGGMPQIKAVVRWESAGPVREALKKSGASETHYIITVTGLPTMGGRRPGAEGGAQDPAQAEQRRKAMIARMRESSTLSVKGKDPIAPESVEAAASPGGQVLVLRFSRESLPIQTSDKEVTFLARLGPLEVKTKFVLKEMTWKGKLDL